MQCFLRLLQLYRSLLALKDTAGVVWSLSVVNERCRVTYMAVQGVYGFVVQSQSPPSCGWFDHERGSTYVMSAIEQVVHRVVVER